jgi:hypothetical protein
MLDQSLLLDGTRLLLPLFYGFCGGGSFWRESDGEYHTNQKL